MTRGFAFLADPAEYGSSSVMTFVVNKDGIVFHEDSCEPRPTRVRGADIVMQSICDPTLNLSFLVADCFNLLPARALFSRQTLLLSLPLTKPI
jgi:Protein of unknown function (DUF2950)